MPDPDRTSSIAAPISEETDKPNRTRVSSSIIRIPISAERYICPMRGGASSHLIRCTDGEYYVVKFAHNLQGPLILANELLATQLAERLGLPVPPYAIVRIDAKFIASSPALTIHWGHQRVDCPSGLAFASRYQSLIGDEHPLFIRPLLTLPPSLMGFVDNRKDFYGMLVFDKWVCNTDHRQVVFTASQKPPGYRVHMIDNGFCFNGNRWDFPDAPTRGLCSERFIYEPMTGMSDFKLWLTRLEKEMSLGTIKRCASNIPPMWYGHDVGKLHLLVEKLYLRRTRVCELLEETVRSIKPRLCPYRERWWPPERGANRKTACAAKRDGHISASTTTARI